MSTEMIALYGTVITVLFGGLVYFLKRTMNKVDTHDIDINHIKQTYVEKIELDKTRNEVNKNTDKLSDDIAEMKETFLTKEDFYRSQASTDKKLDKIYDLILEMKGGSRKDG